VLVAPNERISGDWTADADHGGVALGVDRTTARRAIEYAGVAPSLRPFG
jgi:hypothetical protein